jgi:DDE_Tnp_1-associated
MARLTMARNEEHFATLPDPRRREEIYPLVNIVVIALGAVISGADDFVAITRWARIKRAWLAKFLDLSAGISSHDRFNAIFPGNQAGRVREVLVELDRRAARGHRRSCGGHRRQDAPPLTCTPTTSGT